VEALGRRGSPKKDAPTRHGGCRGICGIGWSALTDMAVLRGCVDNSLIQWWQSGPRGLERARTVRLYFGLNDQHGLRVVDGESSASFLEFHIPAAYPTVWGHQCSPHRCSCGTRLAVRGT
jgi:hypothetical protein